LYDLRQLRRLASAALGHDAAFPEHVAAVRDRERHARVLLGGQYRDSRSAQIAQDPPEYLAGFGPAAPGFLNFTLADDWLRTQVDAVLAEGAAFGNLLPADSLGRVPGEFVIVAARKRG